MTSRCANLSKIYLCVPLSHMRWCLLPTWWPGSLNWWVTWKNDNSQHALQPGFFLQWPHVNDALKTYYLCMYHPFPCSGEKKDTHISGWFKSWISGESLVSGEQNTFIPFTKHFVSKPSSCCPEISSNFFKVLTVYDLSVLFSMLGGLFFPIGLH